MKQFKWDRKKILKKAPSYLLTGLLIFIVLNKDAKAWGLQQLVDIGLFKKEIHKPAVSNPPETASTFYYIGSNGEQFSSNDLRGKVVFINFWATWCPPCLAEMPSLNKLYNKLMYDQAIVFLFINEDDDPNAAGVYLKKKGYHLPVFRRGAFPGNMYQGTLPTTVVIDKNGTIVLKHEGIGGYNSDDFIKELKQLE